MKQTVSEHDFKEAFRQADRLDNFSWEGLSYLFEYLEQLEDVLGEEMELDVIEICCDYCEYDSAVDAAEEFGWYNPNKADDVTEDELLDDETLEEEAWDWLQCRTSVIQCGKGGPVIVQPF